MTTELLGKDDLISIFEQTKELNYETIEIYSKIIEISKTQALPYKFTIGGLKYHVYKTQEGKLVVMQVIPKFTLAEIKVIRESLKESGKFDFFQIAKITRKILKLSKKSTPEEKEEVKNVLSKIIYYSQNKPNSNETSDKLFALLNPKYQPKKK